MFLESVVISVFLYLAALRVIFIVATILEATFGMAL